MTEREIQLLKFNKVDDSSEYYHYEYAVTEGVVFVTINNKDAEDNGGNWSVSIYQEKGEREIVFDIFEELQAMINFLEKHVR